MPERGKSFTRTVTTAALAAWLTVLAAGVGHAEPAPKPPLPSPPPPPAMAPDPDVYPSTHLILTSYQRVQPEDYFIPGHYGVFFLSPMGLNCGIFIKGGFGCAGPLPGLPPGATHIGWFNGEQRVHYDWTAAIQFPNVQAVKTLPPRSYINWNESTCVSTANGGTYCERGELRFYITPDGTWLNG